MIPRKASIKKRTRYKNQVKISFRDANPRYFTPVCPPDEIPGIVSHINHLISLGKFAPDEFIPGLKREGFTLRQLSEEYLRLRLQDVCRGALAKTTYDGYYEALHKYTLFAGKDRPIPEICREDIGAFIDHYLRQQNKNGCLYSPRSINRFLRSLRAAFNYALQQEYIAHNPFNKYPQLKNQEIREDFNYYTGKEIKALRKYFSTKPDYQGHIFDFALNTGMRAGGILEANTRWLKKYRGQIFLRIIEKGRKIREIPLNKVAMEILSRRSGWLKYGYYKEIVNKDVPVNMRKRALARARDGYFFFEISTVSGVTHFFMKAKRRLKLRGKINFHSARHTCATRMIEQGYSIEYVKEYLGHADIRTTQIYGKITREKLRNEFNKNIVF